MNKVLKTIFGRLQGRDGEIAPADTSVSTAPAPATPAPEPAPVATAAPRRMRVDPADIAAAVEPIPPEDPPERNEDLDLDLEAKVLEAIKVVRDPEIPVNLVELGLIYDLTVRKDGSVSIEMTLTTPNCPSAAELPGQIEAAARGVEGVGDVRVKVVFSPAWHPGMMSEEARLELNMF